MYRHSRFLTVLPVVGAATSVQAADIAVPADFATIQAAINAAVDGDVVIVAPGGYAGQINFMGKAITVTSEDPLDPAATTLTAAAGSVVTFNGGEGPDSKLIGFTINNVNAPSGGGAFIGVTANPVIESCVFEGNLANNGGGLAVFGSAVVRNTVFVGNTANNAGGGVLAGANSNLTLDGCAFEGNDAPIGSALRILSGALVTNTEVFDNVAGNAVSITGAAPVSLINCTVAGNAATGIDLGGGATNIITIANCIVRNNANQIVGPGAFLDVRFCNVQGGFAGPGNIDLPPMFINAPFGDFRLQDTSPCIDAGENASVPVEIVYDRHGIVRFADKASVLDTGVGTGPIVDMGANEFPPPRRYVKVDAVGNNTGMTWTHAYTDLQDALDEAAGGADITEIWVAAGTYRPDRGTGNRTMSFEMLDDLDILGGFAGTELDASENDPAANLTILGGAIGAAGEADNSYHVVRAINVNSGGRLVGFMVQKGQADGAGVDSYGGGVYIDGGAPNIRECWIRDNYALFNGGGLYCLQGDPDIIRTRFNLNDAASLGGGLALEGGSSRVVNCYVAGNVAQGATGIYVDILATAEITNCTVVANTATFFTTGGITVQGVATTTNTIAWDNVGLGVTTEQQQFNVMGGSATVNYCTIEGWTGALGGTFNLGDNPLFVDADGPDNVDGTIDDNVSLSANSHCIDSGDSGAVPAFVTNDLVGEDRFLDDFGMPNLGSGAQPYVDRGAYEFIFTSCLGDINVSGSVDVDDLLEVINGWGACTECFSDLSANGVVDVDDLLIVINTWGPCR